MDGNEMKMGEKVVDAGNVYLMMGKEHRISRNARASWYFNHLNTNISLSSVQRGKCKDVCTKDELHILSVREKSKEDEKEAGEKIEYKQHEPQKVENETTDTVFRIVPSTKVIFLANKYKFVIVLDFSPSAVSVHPHSPQLIIDDMCGAMKNIFDGITKPFCVPESQVLQVPQIFITVIAHTPLVNCKANQVLVQGCLLTAENIGSLLSRIRSRVVQFESSVAESMSYISPEDTCDDEDQGLTGGLFEDIMDRPDSPDHAVYVMTPEMSLTNMLRYGILGLQLLPENSAAGIVVITDGMIGIPEVTLFESLMAQLRHQNIACSFVQIGCMSDRNRIVGLGQVPYCEMMHFMATATFGAYFSKIPDVCIDDRRLMNIYHKALLTWSFHKALNCTKVGEELSNYEELNENLAWTHRINADSRDKKRMWATPLIRRRLQDDCLLSTSITNLISCRLREGYTIRDVTLMKNETEIKVVMVLPWKDNVWVNYSATSSWPMNSAKQTRVEVTIEASYDFVHDLTCNNKKSFTLCRLAVVKKYWQTLQLISQTDQLLVHLQSFTFNAVYYTVPEIAKKGMPVFVLQPNSNTIDVNIQQASKESTITQFTNFWRAALKLDINVWQKWMHTHRIGMILQHDESLGKHLHIPNSSGRFHTITSRRALATLNTMLTEWSTFVLLESHSYIKLIYRDPEKPPISFVIVRVAAKSACVVLRLAFLGGTSGFDRLGILQELRERIGLLTFPKKGQQQSETTVATRSDSEAENTTDANPSLLRQRSETACCVLSRKPVEKILIRYDRMPNDFNTLEMPGSADHASQYVQPIMSANRTASSVFATLSRYLYQRRWVWSVQHGASMQITTQAIGRILSTITRIRLQEGFHFAQANAGMVNMVLEVDMKNPDKGITDSPEDAEEEGAENRSHDGAVSPCVLQYIVFPPHTTTLRESMSEDYGDEMETTEADGELQIITEVWVEPQYGVVVNSPQERKHMDSLSYSELSQAMFPTDLECISTMITFEHLNLMCQSLSVPSPVTNGGFHPHSAGQPSSPSVKIEPTIQTVPFAFDLLRLIPLCQQVELLFSSLMQDVTKLPVVYFPVMPNTEENDGTPNGLLFRYLLESIKELHDREIILTDAECEQFVSLVKQRDRDTKQYPLPFLTEEPTIADFDDFDVHSESTVSLSTIGSQVTSSNATGSSRAHAQLPLRKVLTKQWLKSQNALNAENIKTRRTSATEPPKLFEADQIKSGAENVGVKAGNYLSTSYVSQMSAAAPVDEQKLDIDNIPRVVAKWRCFIKSITATHIMITFVPASFDDLRFLVQGNGIVQFRPVEDDTDKNDPEPSKYQEETVHPKDIGVRKVHVSGNKASTLGFPSEDSAVTDPLDMDSKSSQQSSQSNSNVPSEHASTETLDQVVEPVEEFVPDELDSDYSDPVNVQDDFKSFSIPIYTYDCPLNGLTDRLVQRLSRITQNDIFQDLKFISEPDDKSHEGGESKAEGIDHPHGSPQRHRVESLKLRQEDSGEDAIYGENKELKHHSTLISEHFLRAFVKGVFKGLRLGQDISSHDVDAAINKICEEGSPIEIDITHFIHSSCGHVRHLLEKANTDLVDAEKDGKLVEDTTTDLPPQSTQTNSSREEDSAEDGARGNLEQDSKESETDGTDDIESKDCTMEIDSMLASITSEASLMDLPPVLDASPDTTNTTPNTAHGDLQFSIDLLLEGDTCEYKEGLHDLIKKKFSDIMGTHFKPTTIGNIVFFYYCPPTPQDEDGEVLGNPEIIDGKCMPSGAGDDDESDLFVSDFEERRTSDADSLKSVKDSTSISSLGDLDVCDGDDEDDDEIAPLFLYLTCSVRSKSGSLKSVSVKNLPSCLAELSSCLGEEGSIVDLAEYHITLDVVCMTLPPEADLEVPSTRPCYQRMTSFASYVSNESPPASPTRTDTVTFMSTTTTGYGREHSFDPIDNLPKPQSLAIESCKEQVSWLLRDEIASAMRLILPVSAVTLKNVAEHVKKSVDQPKCVFHTEPLHFVYGAKKSMEYYIKSFEKLTVPGFRLEREGDYYYLLNDRTVHARAVSSKLKDLGEIPLNALMSPPIVKEPLVRPGEVHPDLQRALAAEIALQSEHIGEKEGLTELHDNSVEVIPVMDAEKFSTDSIGCFKPEDIKISVIRPSPVKEVSTSIYDKDNEDATSGSSIQVLDDKEDDQDETLSVDVDSNKIFGSHTEKPVEGGKPLEASMALTDLRRKYSDAFIDFHKLDTQSSLPESMGVTNEQHQKLSRNLSPLTVMSMELGEKRGTRIRRAHSAASFDKYKQVQINLMRNTTVNTTSKSGNSTPQRRPSGPQTPNRSRNPSGFQTPLSSYLYDTSSVGSIGDGGYDADSSDYDEEGAMLSFSDHLWKPFIADFWMIMKVDTNEVQVFFHTRDTGNEDSNEYVLQRKLYDKVLSNIKNICRSVNQRLLLEDLNSTRNCNMLLVPEADEDVRWDSDKRLGAKGRPKAYDSDDSDSDTQHKYLAASLEYGPGHFACDVQWQKDFAIHPRVKHSGTGAKGISRGCQALKTVMDRFSVNNRKNMFVIKAKTGAVFYLRLEENSTDGSRSAATSVPDSAGIGSAAFWEESFSASRSSSMWSVAPKRNPELQHQFSTAESESGFESPRRLSSADKEFDTRSISTLKMLRTEDTILLTAYGIEPVGEEINKDLVQMLQKKLDEAVLEQVWFTLARNKMCKLTYDDVTFIQMPYTKPANVVRLTIPPCAMLQQHALSFYLRQNLLQFLFTPKYAENRPDAMFRDFTEINNPVIDENNVFLYNRPQQSGGKGIACFHLKFVDGRGNPIHVMSSPKPSPDAYKDQMDKHMFEGMIQTSLYEVRPESRFPEETSSVKTVESEDGPTAVLQFDIWERGDIDRLQITEKLLSAMKHAVCDIVMEYRLLTAPLCEIPQHYNKGQESPMHSAPPSPGLGADPRFLEGPRSADVGTRTPKEKGAFISYMSDMFKSRPSPASGRVDSPKTVDSGGILSGSHGWQELENQKRLEKELRQKIHKFETGDRGSLHPLFPGCLWDWLQFCSSNGVPSVQKIEGVITSRYSIEYVIREFASIVNNLEQESPAKVFKLVKNASIEHETLYLPYTPIRAPQQSQDLKSESSLDMAHHSTAHIPGKASHYIVVSRNVKQWRMSIDYVAVDEEVVSDVAATPKSAKSLKGIQRFPPLLVQRNTESESREKSPDTLMTRDPFQRVERACVPRQRFLILVANDKNLKVFTYNWSGDSHSSLEAQLNRLIQWQNARSHLLNCIISQKMGLYQHIQFSNLPDPHSQDGNPFVQSVGEVDLLVKYPNPPVSQLAMRSRSGSMARQGTHIHPGVPVFEEIYRDVRPSKPMHKSGYNSGKVKDPLHRNGAQMLELKSMEKKENEKKRKLEELYIIWQQRVGSANVAISEEILELLKNSSRLIHCVVTPILFSPKWRERVLPWAPPPRRHDSQSSDKSRSRHSSGASIRSKRSDSMDKKRTGVDSPEPSQRNLIEEAWHIDLRTSIIQQYIQYLVQSPLGFIQVKTRPPTPKRSKVIKSSEKLSLEDRLRPGDMYLQKTLRGGIMLIELGFREVFFCVNVYAFEYSRLAKAVVNRQLAVLFTDECDKFKELTHIHSFSYDYHLRTIQAYITGSQLVFKQGYHLHGLLKDFFRYFPNAPSYARNDFFESSYTNLNTTSPSNQLFDYMLKNDKLYGMRAVRMVPYSPDESETESEYALLCHFNCDAQFEDTDVLDCSPSDYDVGLIITHDTSPSQQGLDVDRTALRLKYYVILTSKKDLFPKPFLEKKIGVEISAIAQYSASEASFEPPRLTELEEKSDELIPSPPIGSVPSKEIVNYLGFSNRHRTALSRLLTKQAIRAKDKIETMVENSITQCRRDLLWQRMLITKNIAEEEIRRKRRSERMDTDQEREPFLTRLSFSEFEELLEIGSRQRLSDIDQRLRSLENMHIQWYLGLAKVLVGRYNEHHRYFSSSDGLVQYVVALNPNNLDAFMMLGVDSMTNKAELCAVYREPFMEEMTRSGPNIQAVAVQNHIEGFVNACCYHLWSGLF